MKIYTIDLTSWSASFRFRLHMSGMQPTYKVPPVSTVLGIINAAAGRYLKHSNFLLGYYFQYQGMGTDTELIYMRELNTKMGITNSTRTNVLEREFLCNVFLRIYCNDSKVIDYLKNPAYPIVIGRSGDLATIDLKSADVKILQKVTNANFIRGQVVPFNGNMLPGTLQALPLYFTDEVPRQEVGLQPYSIIDHGAMVKSNLVAYRDDVYGNPVDIYFHEINT